MSFQRFCTNRVTIMRPGSGGTIVSYLPTGERDETAAGDVSGAPIACRIRPLGLAQGIGYFSEEIVAADSYVIQFPSVVAVALLPRPNDDVRDLDSGQHYTVTGFCDLHGDRGHAMAHYEAPIKRVGQGS